MNKKLLNSLLRKEKGQVIVLSAIVLTVLLGITAFTVDVGFLQWQKRQLQNAADASSLAGARELIDGDAGNIDSVVINYVEEHGLDSSEIKLVDFGDNYVTVVLKGNRDLFFARVLEFDEAAVASRATAVVGPPTGMSGLIPIGLQEAVFDSLGDDSFSYITKDNFGIVGPGNWGWVDLAYPQQSNVHSQNKYIEEGYPEIIYTGDIIERDTGSNITSVGNLKKLEDILNDHIENSEILYIPVICNTEGSGTYEVTVLGFAALKFEGYDGKTSNFSIEGVLNPPHPPVGRFIDPDAPDFGLKGIALLE